MEEEKKKELMSKQDFIALEFLRLVSFINQTDPRSSQYGILLENIERFGAAAVMFDELWQIFASYYGNEPEIIKPEFKVVSVEEIKEEPEAEPQTEEPLVKEVPDSPMVEEPEMFETEEAPAEEAPVYAEADVKKAIGKARADGKLPKIKDWLVENWGVEGFSALPASKYGEAMEKLKAMGVEV